MRGAWVDITIDGVQCARWFQSDEDPPTDEARLDCLSTTVNAYVERAPFLRFDESAVQLVRRLGSAVTRITGGDTNELVDTYLLRVGPPNLEREQPYSRE